MAIVAGGRVTGDLASELGTSVKALAPIGGATPLDAAIDAARSLDAQRVVAIGGDDVRAHAGHRLDDVIDEAPEGRENVRRAIGSCASQPLLLMASDLPFVDGDALRAFVERASPWDLAIPIASEAQYVARYPGAPPHATRIGRERIANGSVVYFSGGVAPRVLEMAQRLFEARKSLTAMAKLLGPAVTLAFATGTLTIGALERRAAALFGVRARAINDSDPGLCFDLDTLEDYRYAVRVRT